MAGYVYKGTNEALELEVIEHPKPEKPYPGVLWDKKIGKWRARIKYRGKQVWLGYHIDPLEALRVMNDKRAELKAADPTWNTLKPCGTHAAYHRHLRHNEKPCLPCVKAETAYVRSVRTKAA